MRWQALASLALLAGAAEPERRLELEAGEQRSFLVEGLQEVAASGQVIELRRLEGEQFVIFGLREGQAQLSVHCRGEPPQLWRVVVRQKREEQLLAECRQLFGPDGCAGVEILPAAGRLVLRARVSDLQAYHRVRDILRAFPELYPLVEVEPQVLDALAAAISAELQRLGLSRLRVERVGGRLFLEGTVTDQQQLRKASLLVDALYEEALGGK